MMRMRIIHIALRLLPLVACLPVAAQPFNPYYNFKHLNVENGLANNIVYHFLQDTRGYMWLGTRNGITLYDGIRTINFMHDESNQKSLADNFITRILEDDDHSIWIGNNAGIDLFNPADNSFTHFGIGMKDGHKENTYCVLLGFSDKHNLWLIDTKEKAIKIFNTKTKEFSQVTTTDAVDGMLYVNRSSNTVHVWTYLSNGSTHYIFHNYSLVKEERFFNDEKNTKEPRLLIFHVFFQNDSTAWLSTAKGLIELNPVTRRYKLYNRRGKEPVIETRYVAMSPKGLLWVGTGGYGIYTFDIQTKQFIDNFRNSLLDPYSICSSNIVSMYFDKVGNIWCGSYGSGASYANVETRFFKKHLSKNEMDKWAKQNNVYWLGQDLQGRTWCVLRDALGFLLLDSFLKVKEFRIPILENGKKFDGPVYQLFFDSKFSAWCMTDRGLYHYNIITNKMKQVQYPKISKELFGSYWTNYMMGLRDGAKLFSTWGGIYRIRAVNGKQVIQPLSELNNLPFKSFEMVFEDRDRNLYVNDLSENLYILQPAGSGGDYKIIKTINFLPRIQQIMEADSIIYLATNQGLYLLQKKNLQVEKSPISSLFSFTGVNNVIAEKNKIWVFGDKGLYYYNSKDKSGRLFTVEDGLPSNNFSELSVVLDSSGKCIAGTSNGLVSFYPEKLSDSIYPPRAQLINMYVNDSAKSFIKNPQQISSVTLMHAQNTFSFDFSCISFQHVDASSYEYKLENYDEHWIRSGTSHYTRYSKIPPGKYNFQLRVIDAKGDISPYTKSLFIEIKKAFWQTTVFKLIIAALLVLVIWLLVKWWLSIKIRKQQRAFEKQQAIEKERTRIATDMHDDLGSGLSSIRFLSEKVKRNTFSDVTKNDIDKILSSSSELMDKMNEIVWAMNEKNDSLPDLVVYIRSYAKEYCLENELRCDITIPENIPGVFVSGEIRRNIFLTIKESLHNIVKHAGASAVEIGFHFNTAMSVTIRDNGKGFHMSDGKKETAGNGLKNMRKRIESIGGSFKISNRNGVEIEIQVPLPAI